MGAGIVTGRVLLASNISVGDHVVRKVFGLSLDVDTIWATGIAMVILLAIGIVMRRQATAGVPGKLQLAFETGVQTITRQVEGTIGSRGLAIVPLALTLFVFILLANLLEVFGVGSHYEFFGPPTADVNLPLAMAVFVIVLVHIASLRSRGIVGYMAHYFSHPFASKSIVGRILVAPFNFFLTVIEEIAKPITLALRLFGNLFSGGLMLSLIAALGAWKISSVPIGDVATFIFAIVWKVFDVFFIGPIQAFIFTLLTILYFDTAMATEH
jgi:F-type H+-transporting ATPase subunit a